MSVQIKIAVAEPSLIIRSGLFAVLGRLSTLSIQVVEITDFVTLTETLRKQDPDVLIVNPALLGLYTLQQIRADQQFSSLRCVALLNNLSDERLTTGYDATISLYDSAETIKDKLLEVIAIEDESADREQLSAREREIIVCVVKGMTNKQIAEQLFISTHTVITHRRNIASKLQIHSPAGLTIYAIVNKLVELDQIKASVLGNEE